MRRLPISLVMITKNAEDTLALSLKSVHNLVSEIVVIDAYSKDKTVEIARRFNSRLFKHPYESEAQQRRFAISKARQDWILVLDSDEVVSDSLNKEIRQMLFSLPKASAYRIPFQNYYLGKKLHYGGENYKKLRLFRRGTSAVQIRNISVHADLKGKKNRVANLKNKINHYSYRSIWQMYSKFNDYAIRLARENRQRGEKTSLKKIVLYPIHMFWARFIKDKGYKDGAWRVPLDLGFAYMEFMMYFSMLFLKRKK